MRNLYSLIYLFLGFTSFLASASWEQEQTAVGLAASHSSNRAEESTNSISKVQVTFDTTKLFQGFGIKVNADLAANLLSDNEYQAAEDHAIGVSGKVFLSDISNVNLGVSEASRFGLADQRSSIYLNSTSRFQRKKTQFKFLSAKFGSDQQIRSLTLGLNENDDVSFIDHEFEKHRESLNRRYDVRFQNKVSEDTFVVIKLERAEADKLSTTAESTTRVTNGFLGLKTRYLGSSSIEVLLGTSQTDNFNASGDSEIFSWRLNNELRLSDYYNLTLSAKRTFQDSNDLSFQSNNVEAYTLKGNYIPTDFISLSLVANRSERQLNDTDRVVEEDLSLSMDYNLIENWSVAAGINWVKQNDTRDEFDFDETKVAVGLKWQVY